MKIPANEVEIESILIGELYYCRIEHLPTGVLVSDSHTSEYMAKELAFDKLVNKLKQIKYDNN
jgi:hypothetical protein